MSNKEQIFINTFFDLEERFNKGTEYDLLRASGLIRQLLIDSNSLVEQINKNYKLIIQYRVLKRFEFPKERIQSDGTIWKPLFGMVFISQIEESNNIELLKKDDFFKYKLLFHYENSFTVLDIIKICAHKYGGIHSEDIKDSKNLLLDNANSCLSFNDSKSVLHAMHDITHICISALYPLKNIILDSKS